MKNQIGFVTDIMKNPEDELWIDARRNDKNARKSVVNVYFRSKDASYTYYNDSFDLRVGDLVYVEGKLEGERGQVTEVNYSFKIKVSDYKRVISVAQTEVRGDLYLCGSHIVTFGADTLPYEKVITWVKAPLGEEEYEVGYDEDMTFALDDLSGMNIDGKLRERGHDYYVNDRVLYIELKGTKGRAIVEGREIYELEFGCEDRVITNLKCPCFCTGACKHQFAVMLQLNESLRIINENYNSGYRDYFAVISRSLFYGTVMNKRTSGKIMFGD